MAKSFTDQRIPHSATNVHSVLTIILVILQQITGGFVTSDSHQTDDEDIDDVLSLMDEITQELIQEGQLHVFITRLQDANMQLNVVCITA